MGNAAQHSISECINTHHRNSSNSTQKVSLPFLSNFVFRSSFRNGKKWRKRKTIYSLLSVTNDIFYALSRTEKVRKYIARFSTREEKERFLPKITIFHYLIDFTLGGLRGAKVEVDKGTMGNSGCLRQ